MMAVTTAAVEPAAADEPSSEQGVAPRPFVWTRALYRQLGDAGILAADDCVELIEGELVEMPAQKPPHAVAVGLAQDVLGDVFRQGFHIRSQAPLGLGDRSEP